MVNLGFTVRAMLVSVVCIRRDGRRLTRGEIEASEPQIGRLRVHDWREGNASRRALRVAELKHASTIGSLADPLPPIFDPVLVRVNDRGMVLMGFEVRQLPGGEVVEHVQGWWVRPARAS